MRLALYKPDIPQNVGTIMRLCVCLGVPLDIIEPCGFPFNTRQMKRAGMDYIDRLDLTRHPSFDAFQETYSNNRIILMTTKTDKSYTDFKFEENDILLAGRESAGVPESIHNACNNRVTIKMEPDERSLNIAISCAMIAGEAIRQLDK